MAKAKGTVLIGAVKLLRSRKEEAREILPDDFHHYLSDRISEAAWYPEEDSLALIRALVRMLPGPRDDVLRTMGVVTARFLGEGVYSHLVVPGGSAAGSFAMWASMHDTGELRIRRENAESMVIELSDYAAPSPEMCVIIGAYLEETLRMAGTPIEIEKIACALSGSSACSWRAIG